MKNTYDLIVIGAGPAGVSAALYAKSRGLDTLVLEKEQIGGLITKVSLVSHFASAIPGESGESFAQRLKEQLAEMSIPVHYAEARDIRLADGGFLVNCGSAEFRSKKLILATGSTPKELPVDLPTELEVRHFARGSEEDARGKTVLVNGGSDGAVKEAIYLADYAKTVHLIQDKEELLCIKQFQDMLANRRNIVVHTSATLAKVEMQDGRAIKAQLNDASQTVIQDAEGFLIYALIGQSGNAEIASTFVDLEQGFARSEDLKSRAPGLFVAGDVRVKAVRQIATAISDGCLAGIMAAK